MSEFTEELGFARSADDPDTYISRVKLAVRHEFERIDEGATLEDTAYFNHSAVPDFIINWPDKTKRHLYLRDSYESMVAGNDAVRFNRSKPVLLALNNALELSPTGDENADIAEQSDAAPETLITEPQVLDKVIGSADPQEAQLSPLATLVRANLARGGRGLLTPERVEKLLNIGADSDDDSHEPYADRLAESFLPDSAARIARTADLIEVALTGDLTALPSSDTKALNVSEVRTLLPWLLTNPNTTSDPAFWRHIGALLSFTDLVQARESLSNINLTPLVTANLEAWTGRRAYIGLENIPTENASESEILARAEGIWALLGSTLGVNFGGNRLHLAPSGNEIRGRGGSTAVLWQDVAPALSSFSVLSVSLKGVTRSIAINAEQSTDVSGDVEEVTSSVDDVYYVRNVGLGFPVPSPAGDGSDIADVQVNFDTSIVESDRVVPLTVLADVALSVLRYGSSDDDTDVRSTLGLSGQQLADQPQLPNGD
ncbi:hypothetical protein [Mycobacteroides salmoniphilum]|uniref:Uncharacterized protein n=1 Tax=Mycobacteroides salmoniphilum TaxID=404941 RepID=A0A4V3HZS2_9MYCO|nr:hypothetical protein [Mycobacteroides salmoniphilum]TDZ96335.1 hypothetical protein CCUG60885_02479 [Mycobacteroides salmoniphilum]TEA05430.1 hypothetical protein CCUG60883_02736 [Mycobacteroides salmoniphilum]